MTSSPPPPTLSPGRFRLLAVLVISLASLNAFGRLGSETITEWDESLYATSAAEMVNSGNWIATTFNQELDYYNSKPPLNVWLIAMSFKMFGVNASALRLPSAAAAVATVGMLIWWLRRAYSEALALSAGVVLATSFGFFYVHSGRTANPDALFTLLVLATVVTVWTASQSALAFPLIGVLIAAAFLLKGFGALLIIALAAVGAWIRLRDVLTWRLLAGAAAIATALIGYWAVLRWSIDGSQFFRAMFVQDAINRTLSNLEEHPGSIFFYLDVLQRYQYDWIAAGVLCLLFRLPSLAATRAWLHARTWRSSSPLLAASGATLLIVPTAMQTKATWYGNPLLPFLAVAVGAAIVSSFAHASRMRRSVLIAIVILAATVAESRLVWHSYHRRDLASSDQGLLMAHRQQLAGHRVFRRNWNRADSFVATHLVGCRHVKAANFDEFLAISAPGDFWLQRRTERAGSVAPLADNERFELYRREF